MEGSGCCVRYQNTLLWFNCFLLQGDDCGYKRNKCRPPVPAAPIIKLLITCVQSVFMWAEPQALCGDSSHTDSHTFEVSEPLDHGPPSSLFPPPSPSQLSFILCWANHTLNHKSMSNINKSDGAGWGFHYRFHTATSAQTTGGGPTEEPERRWDHVKRTQSSFCSGSQQNSYISKVWTHLL